MKEVLMSAGLSGHLMERYCDNNIISCIIEEITMIDILDVYYYIHTTPTAPTHT